MSDNNQSFDPRERYENPEETDRVRQDELQSRIWTALPVIIKKHDRDTNTVHVKPTIKRHKVDENGKSSWVEIDTMEDVPLYYPGGGGATVTMPVKDGDEALIVFASRDIDKWWSKGGVQEQIDSRMHDLSDGFVLPGFRSQPRKLKDISEKTWQLRSEDGKTNIDFDPDNKTIKINAESDITIESKGKITIKGETVIVEGVIRLGGEDADMKVSREGTVDSRGDVDTGSFAKDIYVKSGG